MRNLIILLLISLFSSSVYSQEKDVITTIILVRHAEKKSDGTKNPDLTDEGVERANRLKTKFEKSGITAIYSSPYKRTLSTVLPLSQAIGFDIIEYNPSEDNFINKIYQQNIGKTVLVSGHSNTTPMAVNQLLGKEKYKDIAHEEYGRIFIVTITSDNRSVLEIQY